MGKFFDTYPALLYDVLGTRDGTYKAGTNVLTRVKILDTIKASSSLYYDYSIQDGDTPEMIADKYYGDPELHWVVLYMNEISDPFYDWPLDYSNFIKYIKNKYGSIENSQTQVHHYEKILERYDSTSQITTTSVVTIDLTAYNSIPDVQNNTFNLSNGTTVTETITRKIVYAWDQELADNEAKRNIKLLRKEYVGSIKNQFQSLMVSLPKVADTVLTAGSDVVRKRR